MTTTHSTHRTGPIDVLQHRGNTTMFLVFFLCDDNIYYWIVSTINSTHSNLALKKQGLDLGQRKDPAGSLLCPKPLLRLWPQDRLNQSGGMDILECLPSVTCVNWMMTLFWVQITSCQCSWNWQKLAVEQPVQGRAVRTALQNFLYTLNQAPRSSSYTRQDADQGQNSSFWPHWLWLQSSVGSYELTAHFANHVSS